MTHLTIATGEASGSRYDLGKAPLVIGRGRDCQIQLRDPMSSRRHSRVYFSHGQWWVEDLGSRNGTLVNGKKIVNAQPLQSSDRLEIGETALVFETEVTLATQEESARTVSSEGLDETDFEDSVGPLWFRDQAFDALSLEILFRIASILNAGQGLPHIVRESLSVIRTFFKADTTCLFLTEHLTPPLQPTLVLSDEPTPPVSERVLLYALRSRRAVCIRDTREELPSSDVVNAALSPAGRSVMCAPLVHRDKVLGAVYVDRSQANYFDHRSLVPFTAIAHLVGGGICQTRQIERLEAEVRGDRDEAGPIQALSGVSPPMEALRARIAEVAQSDDAVLIVGELGAGKHEAAGVIHHSSPRQGGPLVWFHALGTAEERLACELFGESQLGPDESDPRGAGKLEAAHGGTLVVEEIGALPQEIQRALADYLGTLKFQRVGSQRKYFADARLIATNSRPLEEAVMGGQFDPDLFAAVAGLTLVVPPLRERREDIVQMAERLAQQMAPHAGRRQVTLSAQVVQVLQAYSWPGNVRELRSVVERAVIHSKNEELTLADLPEDLVHGARRPASPSRPEDDHRTATDQ